MRLPTRLIPLGAAAVMATLVSAVLAADTQPPPAAAATAPIPGAAPAAPPAAAPNTTASAAPAPAAPAAPPQRLNREQLEQLLAPIALYPDQLLGQILMASTYPTEVVEATRWDRIRSNRALKGNALAAALKPKGWDPSVMALVPFPRILDVMSDRLDWLRDLGTAFVAQQGDVMAAVQHLRHLAMAAGTLKTTPQCHCVVSTVGQNITIAEAAPGPVCVPVYHPRVAYGAWPYPEYPPIDFPVPVGVDFLPGYYIGFYPAVDVAWYWPLWGWDSIDWGAGNILVDPARYSVLAAGAAGFAGGVWAHDPGRWGAVDAARAGSTGGMAAALPGMRGAGGAGGAAAAGMRGAGGAGGAAAAGMRGGGAAAAGPGAARSAASGPGPGHGGAHWAHAGYGAAGAAAARSAAGARWGGHGGHGSAAGGGRYGGGHLAGPARFAGRGGPHGGGGHGGGPAHFAMGGGGPHVAGPHGGGGGGGPHGGGGGGGPHGGGGGGGPHGGGGGGHGH